jgi:hypothetical protein
VEVDRHPEPGRALQDREVARVVEVRVADVRVDVATLEAELGDAPVELVGRLVRRRDGQAREADEAARMERDEGCERVVRLPRVLDLDVRLELLEPRARDAEELDRDARLVQRGDPRLAQVEQRVPEMVTVGEHDVRQRRLEPDTDVLVRHLEARRPGAALEKRRVLRREEMGLEVDLRDSRHGRVAPCLVRNGELEFRIRA